MRPVSPAAWTSSRSAAQGEQSTGAPDTMLKVHKLTKVYEGGVHALTDVSFEVPDGQFLAIIGLSGSGKSTLLRCINRLVDPTEGQILWNGVDVTAASPAGGR